MSDKFRHAIVYSDDLSEIAAYLPMNYKVIQECTLGGNESCVLIGGKDNAGWTLDGYVIPRLGSGSHYAKEISDKDFLKIISE